MKQFVSFVWRRFVFFAAALMAISALTACTGIDGDLMSEKEVLKKVAAEVENEKYELVSVEHDTESRPKVDTYTFRSTERDLTFTAVSTLHGVGIDGSTFGYEQKLFLKYDEGVRALYADRLKALLADIPGNDNNTMLYYDSYKDLAKIAEFVVEADKLWKEELAFNTEDWLKDNGLLSFAVRFRYTDENGSEKTKLVTGYKINGCHDDYQAVYDELTYKHVEKIKTCQIVDDTTPWEQLERYHTAVLPDIYVGEDNISDSAYSEGKGQNLINNTRDANAKSSGDVYSCSFYYPWQTYVVMLNVGLASEDYAPKLVEAYTDALGYACKVDYGKGNVEWTDGTNQVELHAKADQYGDVSLFAVYQNGDAVSVPYITNRSEDTVVHCSYLVGISVEDFAKLFGVKYEIKEVAKEVRFTK